MRTMVSFLYVGAGGCLGAMLRYAMTALLYRYDLTIPYGTLVSNLAGCFLIGAIVGLVEDGGLFSPQARLFLATGLCGGFTTLSSLVYEIIGMTRDGHHLIASFYFSATLLGAALAFLTGTAAVRLVYRLAA